MYRNTDVRLHQSSMTAPFAKGFSAAYKRARSHDSPTPLASPPVLKATKIQEPEETEPDDSEVPPFLRQSQVGKFPAFHGLHMQACIMQLNSV